MYSVRKTTKKHGNVSLHMLLLILTLTAILIWQYGINYLVIFCSSSLLHMIIEGGLYFSGVREGEVYLYDQKLSKSAEIGLRSMVEGPAFCVPSFFVADQVLQGNLLIGITSALLVVGLALFYMGYADRRDIKRLSSEEKPLISRRGMNQPLAMIALAFINTICLIAMFFIPQPYRTHALIYIISYSILVLLFYFINYNLGVRYVEYYDHDKKEYYKPSLSIQIAGLTYDSAYEMALLISPAYWLTFYLGLFH